MIQQLNWLISLVIVALMAGSLAGCATAVRVIEINAGIEVKKSVIDRQTRQANLAKKDILLELMPTLTGEGLNFRLQSQSHYEIQSRSTVKHERTGNIAGVSGGAAILSMGTGLYVASRLENDIGSIILGVGVLDFVTYYLVDKFYTVTKRKQWQTVGIAPDIPEPILNYPVTLSFPLFGYQDTYYTNSAGEITIPAIGLIGKIPNLEPVLYADSIKIDASTTVDGQKQQASFTLARLRDRQRDPLFAIFREQAELRREKPADLVTEVAFSDEDDFLPNNTLDAGEQKGKLTVTIKNKGKGPGIDVKLHLSLENPDIQFNGTRALGDIEPNGERTVVVPITTNLQATNGVANILVEAKEKRGYDAQRQQHSIQVSELKPPRLTITAVEVNDKTLGNAVGNGNGIPENDETIELNVFIKNGGVGNSLGTKLELISLNRGLDVQVKLVDLGTIRPAETVKGALRFHIPRAFTADVLNYKLRVTEIRGADLSEKMDALPMSTQRPTLAYDILAPANITNGSPALFTITPRNTGKLKALNVTLKLSAKNAEVVPPSVILGDLEANVLFQPQPFTVTLPRTFSANQLSLNIRLSQAEFQDFSDTARYSVRHIVPSLVINDLLVADTNGDMKIQQGEKVELELTVTNSGELDALKTQMKVSVADTRIRIEKPQRHLGRLGPNYTSSPERFVFTIPRAVSAGKLPIKVEVDHGDFSSVSRTLAYTIYAEEVITTREAPIHPVQQPQTPSPVVNKPPVIVLTGNLSNTQTVYSSSFILGASVSDNRGLDAVQVTLNGSRIYDFQGDPDAAQQLLESNRTLFSFDVPMHLQEGENKIVITARDNDNEQASRSISVTYERKTSIIGLNAPHSDVDVDIPQGREKNADALALVIGIGKYRDVADATFSDRDAIAFKEYLVRTFGFSSDRVFLLTNEHATYRDIERGLRRIESRLVPNERSDVVVFYAGHGTFKIENNRTSHYLVSYEANPNYPEDGYPLDVFYDSLARLEARSVTVFIDACFSGTDREARVIVKGTRSLILPEMQMPRIPVPVLASSASNQISFSYEPKRHGLFTYYLLKGMRGEADGADGSRKDRDITLRELEVYTREHVSKTADRELRRSQQPTLTSSSKGGTLLKLR